MRKALLVGATLSAATIVVALLSGVFDLELGSVALLGTVLGAVVALVPDRTPFLRLGGFAAGFVVAWVGYLLRAALLPDSDTGRAIVIAVVVLACAGIAAASMGRLPAWATLLGAAGLAGAFEYTYNLAPTQVVDNSVSTVTSVVLTFAIGFIAVLLVAPTERRDPAAGSRHHGPTEDHHTLDSMMETTK